MKPTSLQNCADEPITIPGSVQGHGVLFALHGKTLVIEQVSANCADLLGVSAEELLGTSIVGLVKPSQEERFVWLVNEAAENHINPIENDFLRSDGSFLRCNGIAHVIGNDITLLELEPKNLEDVSGESLDNYFQLVQQTLQASSSLSTTDEISGLMARRVKKFTGFDRVLIYRFAADGSGEVIGEACEPEMEPFLHLHYPASDIPPQARELYLKNWVRLLRDTDAEVSPILPVSHPRLGSPTPLDRSVLRSMSPIHLQYLRNMGVRATLTISLIVDGKLWGLIACHHSSPRFVSYGVRSTSSLFGVVLSGELARAESAKKTIDRVTSEQAVARLLGTMDPTESVDHSISKCLTGLADIFKADGVAYVDRESIISQGSCPDDEGIRFIRTRLGLEGKEDIILTDAVREEFPELSQFLPQAAGLIAIPFGSETWIMIFRDEAPISIRWGGNPNVDKGKDDPGRLTPRASFQAWTEEVAGHSLPWPDHTGLIVDELRSGLAVLVMSRNRILENSNEELRHFASVIAHEVKSQLQPPLMALCLVKEQAPEGQLESMIDLGLNSLSTLSEFTSEMLQFAHMEVDAAEFDEVDLKEVAELAVEQAVESLAMDGVEVTIGNLPARRTSRSQAQHLFLNLVKNAFIHGPDEKREEFAVEVGNEETGKGQVFYVRDNGRGIPEEEQEKIFEYFYRGASSKSRTGTGIGLGFIKRLLERGGDSIWVESVPGEGTTFYFTLGKQGG
ncbi:MAG: ATP-binding protein [Verrucomicrobiaceae bacterium]